MADSFTYCWTDHKTKMLYVGIHKGSYDDGYVCSSKTMLEEYKKRPEDFTRQILAYGTYAEMCKFETAILKSAKVSTNESFYNRTYNNGKFENRKCLPMTAKKISEANKGKPKLKARGERPHVTGERNHFYGKSHSKETIKIMSEKAKARQMGGGNNMAKAIIINNVKYDTMKEASAVLNISLYNIRKMMKTGEIRRAN